MYSSPGPSATGSRPASPHIMATSRAQSPAPPGSRFMQVKVLYSFDDGNKTNCLARCPQPLSIQTAQLDNNTQIGIIELRSCIQAIVSASPELVAKLGHDYTVYAYDYSEYETPLVGQGMLSWVLASASATPTAPAHASRTMVTGRVCKNILGLFSSGGATETLEVKLRLVPVPTCLQSEYLESMQKYRNASSQAVEGIDGDAWSNFLRANPNFGLSPPANQTVTPGADMPLEDMVNFDFPTAEDVHHMSAHSEYGGQMSPFTQGDDSPYNNFGNSPAPQQNSRPATPAEFQAHQPPNRTASRASDRSRQPSTRSRRPSLPQQTSQSSREDSIAQEPSYIQDGPRKRARVERTDWRGPPSFGANARSNSLLRTASTAASIRNQGPMISHKYPTAADIAAGEIGPRPPTPISKPAQRRLLGRPSMSGTRPTSYRSPYAPDPDTFDSSASIASSPPRRGTSVASTPFDDIPSSPPVIDRNMSAAPSSPGLPALQHADSGFVSGALDEYINDDDDEMRPIDYEDLKMAARYKSRNNAGLNKSDMNEHSNCGPVVVDLDMSMNMEMPGDPSQLPTSSDPRKKPQPPQKQQKPQKAPARPKPSRAKSVKTAPSSPRLPPPALPSDMNNDDYAPANGQAMPPPLHAAQIDASRERSLSFSVEPQSEFGVDGTGQRVGSGMKRKKAIEARLRADIAKGIAPQYCKNCGQIETPTWRKCFVAFVQEMPKDVKVSEEEFGIWCVEPMKDEEKGTIINYALIRRSIRAEEAEQWQETQLCNPCGIHLFKNKRMRPKEKFLIDASKETSEAPATKPKRIRSRKRKADPAGGPEPSSMAPESELDPAWQLPEMPSGRSDKSVAKTSGRSDRSQPKTTGRVLQRSASMGGAQMPQPRRAGLEDGRAMAALQRAIQSSPPRFPGSKHSPIELDEGKSPDPTRRLLFPSPRKHGEMKSLDTNKSKTDGQMSKTSGSSSFEDAEMDKENLPPPATQADGEDDGLGHLFSATPRTPKSKKRTMADPLKTPRSVTRSMTRGMLSSSAKRRAGSYQNPETPTRSAQRQQGGMAGQEEMTPWTRQLNDMLSEANGPLGSDGFNNAFSDAVGMNDGAFAFSDFTVADGQDAFGFALYEDPHSAAAEPMEGDEHLWPSVDDIDDLLAGSEHGQEA